MFPCLVGHVLLAVCEGLIQMKKKRAFSDFGRINLLNFKYLHDSNRQIPSSSWKDSAT